MIHIAKHQDILGRLGIATIEGVKRFNGVLVKDHHGRRDIFRLDTSAHGGPVLYLKRNWQPHKKDGLLSLIRHGRVWSLSRQEWENAKALTEAGFLTAELVAYGEECGLLWERFSFIITEAAIGDQTMEDFLRNCREQQTRCRVLDSLAREIRRMHDAGFASPDLFTRHIFVDISSQQPRFCLIDMTRLDKRIKLSEKTRSRDLAALNITVPLRHVSARERVRFLRVYAGNRSKQLAKLVRKRVDYLLQRRRKFQDFLRNSDPKVK